MNDQCQHDHTTCDNCGMGFTAMTPPMFPAEDEGRLREFIAFLNTYDEDGHPHASNEAKRRAAALAATPEPWTDPKG